MLNAFLTSTLGGRSSLCSFGKGACEPKSRYGHIQAYVLLVPAIKPRVQYRLDSSPVTKQTELPRILDVLCGVTVNAFDSTGFFVVRDSSVQRLATGWTGRGSNPGGGEIFRAHPHRSWGPPSLLYSGYWVSLRGVKRPAWCWPPALIQVQS